MISVVVCHRVNCHHVARFTAPVDVAKDAILVAKETLSTERPSFEIGQFSDARYAVSVVLCSMSLLHVDLKQITMLACVQLAT